jgi:hypothetical protein
VQQHADALFRAARECCHQHDRYARVLERTTVDLEERAAQELCRAADTTLAQLADAYGRVVAEVRPGTDEPWRRLANSIWLASREFTKRHRETDEMTRRIGRHSSDDLETLHTEFELEASALLALRHACADYQRARPEAI